MNQYLCHLMNMLKHILIGNRNMKEAKIKCKCGYEDYVQSQFCSSCNREFSFEQKQEAYKKTPFSKVQSLKKKESTINKVIGYVEDPIGAITKSITGKRPIKIALIIIFIVLGSFMYITNRPLWNRLTILPTADYVVTKDSKVYYLSANTDKIDLKIGCIKDVDKATITLMNNTQEAVEGSSVKVIKGTTYKLTVNYTDGTLEELNFMFN